MFVTLRRNYLKNILNKLSFVGFAICLGLCVYLSGVFGYAKDFCETKLAPSNSQTAMNKTSSVFACIPGTLTKEQRERAKDLNKQYIAPKPNFTELSDGFSFIYEANEQSIKDIAEFVSYERLCCPFVNFDISVEGKNLQLKLHGEEGVKDFIKSEFGV